MILFMHEFSISVRAFEFSLAENLSAQQTLM